MTVGGLISFLAAIMMLYKPLKDVTKTNMAFQIALSSARRVFELIDFESEIAGKNGFDCGALIGDLECIGGRRRRWFGYRD